VSSLRLELRGNRPARSFRVLSRFSRPGGLLGIRDQADVEDGSKEHANPSRYSHLPRLYLVRSSRPDQPPLSLSFYQLAQLAGRASVLLSLPYDRANTTMKGFPMCEVPGRVREPYDQALPRPTDHLPGLRPHLELWTADLGRA